MGEKVSVDIKGFWFTDVLVMPKFVTIVTTVNEYGLINAAPYSLGAPYDVGKTNPRIMLGIRKGTHSFKNIMATKEFVVNLPTWSHLKDIMETARFWPRGEDELVHTSFSTVPSRKVIPPSIKECPQHIECGFDEVLDVGPAQSFVVGTVLDIVVDEELVNMEREDRIRAVAPPIYLGDKKKKYYYFGKVEEMEMHELLPPDRTVSSDITFTLSWNEDVVKELSKVPSFIQEVVVEVVEEEMKNKGNDTVDIESYKRVVNEYAPEEFRERFD